MRNSMTRPEIRRAIASALTLSLGLALAGCGGMPTNRQLDSVHQPIVERTNYTLDVSAGPGGLSLPEQRRLTGWFEAMDLRYGDRISIDDPLHSGASRSAVEAVASRFGMLVGEDTPVTPGHVNAGTVRVIVTRSSASVPGCPDWSAKSDTNLNNGTSAFRQNCLHRQSGRWLRAPDRVNFPSCFLHGQALDIAQKGLQAHINQRLRH